MALPWLDPDTAPMFPALEHALQEPNGLLAAGGSLTPDWLVTAYAHGIFPWFEEGQPILWWSPDPRLVLIPGQIRISRSLKKLIKKQPYLITFDQGFSEVIENCQVRNDGSEGTWITDDMKAAYVNLHKLGIAHSVEVWSGENLVGGLYGVALGKVFFGESMFSHVANASKLALVALSDQLDTWQYELIDCQVTSEHLLSLGAKEISRSQFSRLLQRLVTSEHRPGRWTIDEDTQINTNAIE